MLSERMGMTLAQMGACMSSEEFGLRMALELQRQGQADEPKDDWD